MKRQWFVEPDTVRIDLGDGDWLELKKQLTVGESTKATAQLVKEIRQDGRVTPDFEMMGKAEAVAYITEWSLGASRIRMGDSDAKKLTAINGMTPEAFKIISEEIQKHVETQETIRKNGLPDGATTPSVVSTSAA